MFRQARLPIFNQHDKVNGPGDGYSNSGRSIDAQTGVQELDFSTVQYLFPWFLRFRRFVWLHDSQKRLRFGCWKDLGHGCESGPSPSWEDRDDL